MPEPLLEQVFKTNGIPTYTFVEPQEWTQVLLNLRSPGRGLVIEGPSGIGKTTAVEKALERLKMTKSVSKLSARRPADVEYINALPDIPRAGVVIIDDFHKLATDVRRALADYMKTLADEEAKDTKIIAVGINKAGQNLIEFAHDLVNRLDVVPFESNPDAKVHELISLGSQALNVQLNVAEEIVAASQGSFYLAQMLCLEVCTSAGILEKFERPIRTAISFEAVRAAVWDRLAQVFRKPTERFCRGTKMKREGRAPYLHVLRWLAEGSEWTLSLRDAMRKFSHMRGSVSQVVDKGYLRQLVDGDPDIAAVMHYDANAEQLSVEDPPAHATAFAALGPQGRMLVTTRDRELLDGLGADTVNVDVLAPHDAGALLGAWAHKSLDALPPEASDIAKECGYLPLALALAGARIKEGTSWRDVLQALHEGDLEFLDHAHGSVFKSLAASVRALPEPEAARYRELAIFPEDTSVPEAIITPLWTKVGMKQRDARKLLRSFANRALLFLEGEEDRVAVRLHDLQSDFLRLVAEDRRGVHARFLETHHTMLTSPETGPARWTSLPPDNEYLWRHLFHHLVGAGELVTVRALVTDSRWLAAKIAATGVASLISELARLVEEAPTQEIRNIERALRLEAGWLHQDPGALQVLLYNRLRSDGLTEDVIARLGKGLRPAVRLRHPVRLGEERVFRGHGEDVHACAYSADGTRVLSASKDCTVREWDRQTGRELRRFDGHGGSVNACAYSPDGTRVLSASDDLSVREWDRETGRQVHRFQGHTRPVTSCAYSHDGARVVTASHDRTVREWSRDRECELRRFEGHADSVNACAYSSDGSRVLSGSWDNTLREWDRETGRELRRLEGHTHAVRACVYSPDGSRVLSASDDWTVREWSLKTGEQLRRFEGHTNCVNACAYSSDGSRALSASWDETVREWDCVTGVQLLGFEGHTSSAYACTYSPDGTRVLSASKDMTVREWDRDAASKQRRFEGHTSSVNACAYSPDGTRLVSASSDRTVREWNVETGREMQRLAGHVSSVNACTYSSDGTRVLSASWDTLVHEWDVGTGHLLQRFVGHTSAVNACAYSPDGATVLSASRDNTIRQWNRETGRQLLRVIGVVAQNVTACAYSLDGERILSASDDRIVREWSRATGQKLRDFRGHTNWVNACAYSPDGARVLSASLDCTVREWDRETGREVRLFKAHASPVTACTYSLDGTRVISASYDSTIKIWSREDGRCLFTLYGVAPFLCLAAAPGQMAAGDQQGNVWLMHCDFF